MEIRSITIKLPADHPVFKIPHGNRSEAIRRWLKMGMSLSRLSEAIESESKKLDRALELLQGMKGNLPFPLNQASITEEPKAGIADQEDEIARNLDLTSLNDAIKDFFLDEEGGNQ